ncbi:MAG TPA: protein phosphatase 2C domain-containing protein, partial [Pseudomonadales bacterium]|nr:protein phosphatase 2C domain-containing protein [Pseudomonadales bacterium]
VADGMGGHEAGEVASAIAIESIARKIRQGKDITEAIQNAHHNILNGTLKGRGAKGMGSTVVAVHSTITHYRIAWVGDSRAYLWTRTGECNGTLEQLTTDHSYVQMLVKAGAITPEEAINHRDKNVITQCLGSLEMPDVTVDTVERDWQPGQWLLLCSDGLTDELEDGQISAVLANSANIEIAAESLLREALASGGRDNTTIAIITQQPPAQGTGSLWDSMVGWIRR